MKTDRLILTDAYSHTGKSMSTIKYYIEGDTAILTKSAYNRAKRKCSISGSYLVGNINGVKYQVDCKQ